MSIESNISSYLSGKMSQDERQAFEAKIKANPELQKEVDTLRSMDLVFDHLLEEDIRAHLKEHNGTTSEASTKSSYLKYAWGILLLAAALIASYFLLNIESKKVSESDIFAQFYKIPLNKDAVRSGTNQGISLYDQAKIDFYLGELETSKKAINQVLPSLSTRDSVETLQHLLGHIAFQNKEYGLAIDSWDQLTSKEAIYDKALAYYLLDSISRAKALLIRADTENAHKLLEQLK